LKAVLHIIAGLEPGGAETALFRMVTAMRTYRHVVLTLGGRGVLAQPLEEAGAVVEALRLRDRRGAIAAPRRLYDVIRRSKPDLIQSWMVHANALAALSQPVLAPGVPLVWNVRQSLDALDKEKWLTRRLVLASPLLARLPSAIIYNSIHSASQHEARGYPSSSREVIPNGFDTEEFAPQVGMRERVRSELGIADDRLLIGLVGRFHPVKNHAGFLEAATRVLRAEPRAHFLLVGTGTETERVLQLVEDGALRDRLIGLGQRRDIARITGALDIACNVSHSEAFPNAVAEAMACAIPCVITPVGESRRIVGDTGMVAEDTSGGAIAEALLRMARLSSAERADLGNRARERIVNNYSLLNAALRYERLYHQLIAGGLPSDLSLPASRG
jgi:glycosyltransferase involved in cell wall biosynthesis